MIRKKLLPLVFIFLFSCKIDFSSIDAFTPYLISLQNASDFASTSPALVWNVKGEGEIYYDLYLSQSRIKVETLSDDALLKKDLQSHYFYFENELEKNKKYYWLVVSKLIVGSETSTSKSEIFSFTTGEKKVREKRYFAVTVGIGKYNLDNLKSPRFKDLKSAPYDAIDFANCFAHLNEPYQIYSLSDYVSVNELILLLDRISPNVQADDEFVFHFSGHGELYDNKSVLVFSTTPQAVGKSDGKKIVYESEENLSATRLFSLLANFNCNKTLFIDCCHSGGVLNALLQNNDSSTTEKISFSDAFASEFETLSSNQKKLFSSSSFQKEILRIFCATTASELSWEATELSNGLFTFSFLDGIGASSSANESFDFSFDADSPKNYKITYKEILRYTQNCVNYHLKQYSNTASKKMTISYLCDDLDTIFTKYF